MIGQPSIRTHDAEESLWSAVQQIALHPWRNLMGLWNWKSAGLSATIRAFTFFTANLRAGSHKAARAMAVEAAFAIFAAGLMGAVSQRLRATRPYSATALVVWLAMPLCMVGLQSAIHQTAATPHMRVGLIASFCFAAFASGFTWFTMRRGVMLAGGENKGLLHDVNALPRLLLEFVMALPRTVLRPSRM